MGRRTFGLSPTQARSAHSPRTSWNSCCGAVAKGVREKDNDSRSGEDRLSERMDETSSGEVTGFSATYVDPNWVIIIENVRSLG
jgi:hypothetical protein